MGDEGIYLVIAEANETSEIVLNIYDVSDESICAKKKHENNLNNTVLNEVYSSLIVNDKVSKTYTDEQLELPIEEDENELLILDSEDILKTALEKNEDCIDGKKSLANDKESKTYTSEQLEYPIKRAEIEHFILDPGDKSKTEDGIEEKNLYLFIQRKIARLLDCQNVDEAACERIYLDKELHDRVSVEMIDLMLKQKPKSGDLGTDVCYGDKNGLYKCKYCYFSNWNEQVVVRHYRTKHGPKYLYCLACGHTYSSTTSLYRHEHSCRATLARVMRKARCVVADRLGWARASLTAVCRVCEKAMPRSALRRHEATHSELQIYQCHLCPAGFRSSISLAAHKRAHSGVRPYQCERCPRAYTSRSSLNKHILTHSEALYFCHHCGRGFRRKDALINHIKTHEGGTRRFLCTECGKRFTQKFTLVNHLRKHRGLPPRHRCTQCSRRFGKMSVLKVHMKKQHNLNLITKKMFYNRMPAMPSHEIIKEDINSKIAIYKVER